DREIADVFKLGHACDMSKKSRPVNGGSTPLGVRGRCVWAMTQKSHCKAQKTAMIAPFFTDLFRPSKEHRDGKPGRNCKGRI
ncbi:MAG: hypothetical protein U1E02_42995, partial [Hydrogenophaga sp.]|nr:hypothetical protein [Hydrogenophaga sp.]